MAKRGITKLLLIVGAVLLVFLPSFAKYQELCSKNRMLDNKIRELTVEVKKLQLEKKRLEGDIIYIEKKAREKIGVVRHGEIILKETPAKK